MTKRRESGFTLLELLVALSLVGLMSVAIFGGLRFGTRTWEAGSARSEQINEVVLTQSLMRRHLIQLAAFDQVQQRSETAPVFEGEGQFVRFLAPLALQVGLGGVYQFELAVEDGAEGRARLVIRWRLYRPDRAPDEPFDPADQRVLLDGLEDAEFRYFGAVNRRDDPEWRELWPGQALLPSLIALEVAFPDGDRRRWPLFQVAPRRLPSLERLS